MSVKKAIVNALEEVFRYCYGWISENDESLGRIVSALHIVVVFGVFVMILISHFIYPVLWFQIFVFCIVFLIWIQHILLQACVCSSLERKLMGNNTRLAVDPVLVFFKIPVTKDTRMGITVLLSTIVTGFLGLELVARGVMYSREQLHFSPWG